jgi:hypothetical protein
VAAEAEPDAGAIAVAEPATAVDAVAEARLSAQ